MLMIWFSNEDNISIWIYYQGFRSVCETHMYLPFTLSPKCFEQQPKKFETLNCYVYKHVYVFVYIIIKIVRFPSFYQY